jgi:hypothetical protein
MKKKAEEEEMNKLFLFHQKTMKGSIDTGFDTSFDSKLNSEDGKDIHTFFNPPPSTFAQAPDKSFNESNSEPENEEVAQKEETKNEKRNSNDFRETLSSKSQSSTSRFIENKNFDKNYIINELEEEYKTYSLLSSL